MSATVEVTGDYDLTPQAWADPDERVRAVMFWTQALRERAWRQGLTLAEQPDVSWTPPGRLSATYRRHDMGRLRLTARAWRRLDHQEDTDG